MVGITLREKLAAGMYIVVALAYGWMIVSYGVMFWRTRRYYPLDKLVTWTTFCIFALFQTWNLTAPSGMLTDRSAQYSWPRLLIIMVGYIVYIVWPIARIYQRWVGRAKEPGYAHARDLLLLRRPDPIEHPFPDQGKTVDFGRFVRNLPKVIALSIVITLGFFLLTKLIFDFGPFF